MHDKQKWDSQDLTLNAPKVDSLGSGPEWTG